MPFLVRVIPRSLVLALFQSSFQSLPLVSILSVFREAPSFEPQAGAPLSIRAPRVPRYEALGRGQRRLRPGLRSPNKFLQFLLARYWETRAS